MSLPKYPHYKPSGVQWLGDVPAHWTIRRLGYYFQERREKVSDKDFPALSVTKLGVVPQLETAAKTDDGDNRKKVLAGDFVINSRSDRKGSSGAAFQDGSVSLINTVLQPASGISLAFAHHLLRSVPFHEEFYRYGKGIVADLWSTNYSEMRNILLAIPEVTEQVSIAAFLDHETAKIDALIAEQDKLIKLLAEKRQATISHAVTRGLNPDAPMKDSGVAWLGEVPVHWEVVPAKRVASVFVPQRNKPELNDIGDGICWATMEDVRQPRIRSTRWFVSQDAIADAGSRVLERGAVIASCVGNFGVATINEIDLVINQQLQAFIPGSSVSADFLAGVVLVSSAYFELVGTAATLVYVNQEGFENLPVPLPPLAEQTAIVKKLAVSLSEIAVLGEQAERAIALLKERRAALIAAAVTGQIDVRQNSEILNGGEARDAVAALS